MTARHALGLAAALPPRSPSSVAPCSALPGRRLLFDYKKRFYQIEAKALAGDDVLVFHKRARLWCARRAGAATPMASQRQITSVSWIIRGRSGVC
jgi:hypothetical protein